MIICSGLLQTHRLGSNPLVLRALTQVQIRVLGSRDVVVASYFESLVREIIHRQCAVSLKLKFEIWHEET